MKIDRLDHIVLAVRDLPAAADTWKRAFALAPEPTIAPENTHLELSLVPVGDAFIELARATTPDHRVTKFVEERGEGMFSISLQVADLDAAVAELRGKDIAVSDPEPGVFPDTRVARIPRASAHGVAIQLIER